MSYKSFSNDELIAMCKEKGLNWKSRLFEEIGAGEFIYQRERIIHMLQTYDKVQKKCNNDIDRLKLCVKKVNNFSDDIDEFIVQMGRTMGLNSSNMLNVINFMEYNPDDNYPSDDEAND